MSTSERNEFATLIEAHAGRSLTRAEEQRLRALAAADPERSAELAAIDGVHRLLDGERVLRVEASQPTTAAEESDEGFQRLGAAAARAEEELRAKLMHGAGSEARRVVVRRVRRWPLLAAAAAALIALGLWLAGQAGSRPDLLPERPGGETLGGVPRIMLRAELSVQRPELSWHPVVGASRYDASIEDADGGIVLQRASELGGSTTWELARDEIGTLVEKRDAGAELTLRVVARDRAGVPVASTGDLPLRLVD